MVTITRDGKNDSIKSIQILRAIAALGVVYYHCTAPEGGYNFPQTGSFGVDIFFVISGFIIAYMVEKNTDRFFIKRIIRIAPLYIIATSLMMLAVLVFPNSINSTKVSLAGFIQSILFIPYKTELRDGPILAVGWTLNLEMFFYLIMFLCILFVKNKKYLTISCAFILIVLTIILNRVNSDTYLLRFYQNGLFPEFIYGMALYHCYAFYNKRFDATNAHKFKAVKLAVFMSTAVMSIAYLVVSDIYGSRIFSNRNIFYGIPALTLTASLLLLEKYIGNNRIVKLGLKLGDASYAVYLFHLFIIMFLSRIIFPRIFGNVDIFILELVKLILALALTVFFSMLLYDFVDKPIQNYLRSLRKGK
jgi:peptidoglycan/LPS O-acetylase OafA/YrhL